jgi:hypothetical protein
LSDTLRVACFHREERQRDTSYSRAAFCIDVSSALFDAFFNSSAGYRAAYFESMERGLAANQYLIEHLSAQLQHCAKELDHNVEQKWLDVSLSRPSAKAWVGEDVLALCPKCKGGWSTSYKSQLVIENGRWEYSRHTHAAWGRQAPELVKIRIFGGFVNRAHEEWVADHKVARAQQIWEHGWT